MDDQRPKIEDGIWKRMEHGALVEIHLPSSIFDLLSSIFNS